MKQLFSGILVSTMVLSATFVSHAQEITSSAFSETIQVAVEASPIFQRTLYEEYVEPEYFYSADGNYQYTVENNQVSITEYLGTELDVVIPSQIDGKDVVALSGGAFRGVWTGPFGEFDYSITSVTLPATLTSVANGAFGSCYDLTDIFVDGNNPYYSAVDGVLFAPGTAELVFYPSGKHDTTYVIPDFVTSISASAFSDSQNLETIVIPNSVTSIGDSAFWSSSIVYITIPGSINNVGSGVFYWCKNLVAVVFEEGVTTLGDDPEGTVGIKGNLTFSQCDKLSYVVLPKSLQNVYSEVFDYSSLSDVYYMGSATDWANTSIEWEEIFDTEDEIHREPTNSDLANATMHFGATAETIPDISLLVTPEVVEYPSWTMTYIDFVAGQIMPDISTSNYNDSSSRGTIAQSLYNMAANGENVSASHSFSDVGSFGTAIAWCHANGVMSGTSGTEFGTDSNVTREQFALILMQASSVLGKTTKTGSDSDLSGFGDVDSVSSWAKDGMSWAVANGLMSGSDGNLLPKGNITRTEVAVMLFNFDKL